MNTSSSVYGLSTFDVDHTVYHATNNDYHGVVVIFHHDPMVTRHTSRVPFLLVNHHSRPTGHTSESWAADGFIGNSAAGISEDTSLVSAGSSDRITSRPRSLFMA